MENISPVEQLLLRSRRLRWVLIEAAMHQFRRPDDFGRWARQLAVRKGILKARVAVARALCQELFDAWPRA